MNTDSNSVAASGPNVTVTVSPKNLGVALILALLLGPIGLLYATVMGGVVLLVADIIALFIFFANPSAGILFFVAIQIAAICWAIKAINSQNAELLGQLPSESGSADERVRKVSTVQTLLHRPEMGAVAGAIIVFLFFAVIAGDSGMFSALGVASFLEWSAFLGIIAVAAALLMIGGEFDLSVGSMIGFASVCIAIPAVEWGWPLWLAIVFAFSMAVLVGAVNGTLVNKTGLPSFIITLAMLYILRGLTIALTRLFTDRTQVPGLRDTYEVCDNAGCQFTDWLAPLFTARLWPDLLDWNGLPVVVVWFVLLTALATFILLRTQFGNWIFAVGGDKNAARNVGVPVDRVKIILFITTACAATLFATIQVLDAGSADTQRGVLKEFEAIIAAVIGGCLLTGGYGSAIGAAVGAIIFGTVFQGIYYTGINTDWFKVFLGLMLIIAVIFNNFIRQRATRG